MFTIAAVKPLNAAPLSNSFTTITAAVPPFQPEIVPSSVANRKTAGLPLGSANSCVPLKIVPVGVPWLPGPALAGGIVTTRPCGTPAPLSNVASPVPLSDTHHGDPALRESPHGFTRFASLLGAPDPAFTVTLVIRY